MLQSGTTPPPPRPPPGLPRDIRLLLTLTALKLLAFTSTKRRPIPQLRSLVQCEGGSSATGAGGASARHTGGSVTLWGGGWRHQTSWRTGGGCERRKRASDRWGYVAFICMRDAGIHN